jgi:glycerophosphoryl diester phosphodiesterase family protein
MNRKAVCVVVYLTIALFAVHPFNCFAQSVPTPTGFAHNDYKHKHPLFDAIDNGFTNIEADIFLQHNRLVVSHLFPMFHYGRSLEKLYLQPLYEMAQENDGYIYANYHHPVILMIDVKSGADETYRRLEQLLQKYQSMLTHYEDGKVVEGAVTVVMSGHKPYSKLEGEHDRLAFIDDDLRRVAKDTASHNIFTMASCKYSRLLSWTGIGPIPPLQRQRLCRAVALAHRMGSKVRLWASPEKKAVWDELLSCGVDLINTDKLTTFRDYLTTHSITSAKAE